MNTMKEMAKILASYSKEEQEMIFIDMNIQRCTSSRKVPTTVEEFKAYCDEVVATMPKAN